MSYEFVTVNGRKNLRMTEIICDTENDLADIPIEKLEMGSTVYVIETGETQTLASDGTWTVNADGGTGGAGADEIADLAGAGRTTETVKGNADNIAGHITDDENPHAVTLAQLGAAASDHTHAYVPTTRTVNNKALSANIALTAADVGAVVDADLADMAGAGRTTETVKGNADDIADHIADDENPHTVTLAQLGAAASDHTHAYVPTSRTVNGKALSANISLTAADVGAAADADLSNLAGSGRTTETVKGNADALGTALGAALSTLTTTAKTLVGAINEVDGDTDVLKLRPWTADTDADELGTGIYQITQVDTPEIFNYPAGYGILLSFVTVSFILQIFGSASTATIFVRTRTSELEWLDWKSLTAT